MKLLKNSPRMAVFVAILVVAIVMAVSGCASITGPGKRIKDGFASSTKAKTASFTGELKIKLPASVPVGDIVIALKGDADTNGTATVVDDAARMEMTVTIGEFRYASNITVIKDRQWESSGGKTIGGPNDTSDLDSDWNRIMEAIAAGVTDLKDTGSTSVAGVALDRFSARIPKQDVCDRLVPLFAEIVKTEAQNGAAKPKKLCADGLDGPVNLEIGLDDKDWPRLIAARGKLSLVALLELLGAGDTGELQDSAKLNADVSLEMRVSQYDKPIKPIVAPSGAKLYSTLREFERASARLGE